MPAASHSIKSRSRPEVCFIAHASAGPLRPGDRSLVVKIRVDVERDRSRYRPHRTHEVVRISDETVERAILLIRSQRVILDHALARMYGVSRRTMIQAVKRNSERFPPDYMFQLTKEEARKSCGKTTKCLPYAFTEYGVLMLSGVLRSACAIDVSIQIVEIFVRLRGSHAELTKRVEDLERTCVGTFDMVFETIKKLDRAKVRKRKPIGFLSSRTKRSRASRR
jgi:hypothetical protein